MEIASILRYSRSNDQVALSLAPKHGTVLQQSGPLIGNTLDSRDLFREPFGAYLKFSMNSSEVATLGLLIWTDQIGLAHETPDDTGRGGSRKKPKSKSRFDLFICVEAGRVCSTG